MVRKQRLLWKWEFGVYRERTYIPYRENYFVDKDDNGGSYSSKERLLWYLGLTEKHTKQT